MRALILTYHAIDDGPGPLFVGPELFERQLDAILDSGSRVLTVGELATAFRDRRLPDRAVALTFDDGFASVARNAAPLLLERGLSATVFCIAGRLGGTNDWPSQPAQVPRRPLATVEQLAALAGSGFEIGCHGFSHSPIVATDPDFLHREVVDARTALEEAVGESVSTFAYPYGAEASPPASALVAQTYDAACTVRLAHVRGEDHVHALPRVDVHYLRQLALLRRALRGELGSYLRARSLGARARRTLRRDFTEAQR